MSETVFQAATLIIPLILAIVFHEVAHGWMALALGDPTAAEQNRLTLNPLRHVDPIGTVVVPGLLALAKAPVFGWARPVPVDRWRLRNPRSGMMLVAAAGPGINLVMAGVSAVLLGLLLLTYDEAIVPSALARFLTANLMNFITINIFLALFNLLPVPPFDGAHIVEGLLPRKLARAFGRLHKWGLLVMIVLIVVLPWLIPGFDPVGKFVVPPVEWLTGKYLAIAAGIAAG